MLIVQRRTWQFSRQEVLQGLGLGLFGGAGMLFQFDGLAHTEASTSAFVTQGTVIFVPLVQAILRRQWPARRELVCCTVALAGVAVISGWDWNRMSIGRGELETLVAAMFFTGQILWIERPGFNYNDSLRVSLVMFIVVAMLSLSPACLGHASLATMVSSVATPVTWVFLAILIGPCTLLSYLWMNRWQRHVSATTAGLIYCLEPVFAMAFAFFLPGWFSSWSGIAYANETLSVEVLVGGGLILLGNLFMQWPPPRGEPPSLLNEHAV
jgi:drug/metabolite transporter (DMT)-like permease